MLLSLALLVFAIAAVPVLADSADVKPPPVALPQQPAASELAELPDAQDVAEGIAQIEGEEEKRQAELETPGAAQERVDSQQEFADVSIEEALQLFRSQFSEQLEELDNDPARFLTGAHLDQSLEGGLAARVTVNGTPELLDAGIPVQAENEDGDLSKVNLSIINAGGDEGFELANPLTQLAMPQAAWEGIEIGEQGLAITPVGADEGSNAVPFGTQNLFYPSTQTDTDLVVSPVAAGVELSDQLRSSASPETLRFEIGMPAGAKLRADGNGGAIVAEGEKVLAQVPFPTAVDAQGSEVPVELTVENQEIVLQVPHRTEEFAYPIDVDPSLVEDWYNSSWYWGGNLQALSDGSWAWNPGGTNWIYGSTACIWTCWGASNRGLFVSAESGWHGAYQQGQWSYSVPGGTSYISSAAINPFWRNNYANCPASKYGQPHDYDGIWSGAYGWWPLETNRANDVGSAGPVGHGQALIIGLGTAEVGAEDKCRRDIMAGGVAIWISDPEPPTWNSTPTVADEWIDTTPIPISDSASDPGLGMKYFNLWTTNAEGKNEALVGNAVHPCSGLHASPCPYSWSSQSLTTTPPVCRPGSAK